MRKFYFLLLCFSLFQLAIASKRIKPVATVPFEMVGTYVVLKVKINDSSPLNLILDSGLRNTIITELLPGDNITLNYSNVKELIGLGREEPLEAYTSDYNFIKVGKLKLEQKAVLVLKEDIFNLTKHTGSKINGLIGVDFFQDYVIEINYSNNVLKFYNSKLFSDPKGYEKIPLVLEGKKMFFNLLVEEADGTKKDVKMLIDTGAELGAWFQTYKANSVKVPEKTISASIGQGLNGEIIGSIGRIKKICFGTYCIDNPIVAFPDSASISDIVGKSDRDGTIGSQLLSRFNCFIDYPNKQIYIKPNANLKKPFVYNVAGIDIIQIFPFLPQTEVWKVWKNSPADVAGIKVGDQIIEVNGQKTFTMGIKELNKIFETPSNSSLRLKVMREDKELEMEIDMRSRI